MREKKDFCIYAAWTHNVISNHVIYQITRYKITSLDTTGFLDTYVSIINQHWQSSGNIIFLCKCYIVISDTLVGSFLGVLFLLLAVILSEFCLKPRRKGWLVAWQP